MTVNTPDWTKHAVFYQIFPDRFAHSPRTEHAPGIEFKPWGSPPEEQGYQGGDLRGIVDKLDYLQDLGVNALYLNPIFSSASNHRYHTFDYFEVDPLLGGEEALRELLDAAHARDMYVVLDGVFNHASRGFWAFHHILENGGNSPYIDWFIIQGWPLRPYDSNGDNAPLNYAAWWNLPALPKFNTDNPGVRDYLLRVARYWIEFGVDGWRLDVPEEINDPSFWREFRRVVKEANPDAYICGEIWGPAPDWLRGDRFDAVMNYVFGRAALGFFGGESLKTSEKPGGHALQRLTVEEFATQIEYMLNIYPWDVNQVQLNLLDSHDMARALWLMGEDASALRLCVLFQMTMPGAPCIYYGDEIGMSSPGDPHCREAFPWNNESSWDQHMLKFYQHAVNLRREHPVLRVGSFEQLHAADGIYAFSRYHEGQQAVVIFNTTREDKTITLTLQGPAATFGGKWHKAEYDAKGSTLRDVAVPARDAQILISK